VLKQRVITASIIASMFFAALFLFGWQGFFIFMTLVLMIGAWEWANLAGFESFPQRFVYCLFTVLLLTFVIYFTDVSRSTINVENVRTLLIIACTWWALALLWVQGYPSSAVLWGSRWVRAVLGWFVLIPAWLSLVYLHQMDVGVWLIVLMITTVFVADTGAYFFGRAFGKRKLALHVSPGKSWEGFWGGLLCCSLLATFVAYVSETGDWHVILMILLSTALASVLGDLLESMVKRHRGIKDSGSILPGHGGVLDRLDSITAAAPIFALGIILSGWVI
jgi:phosphatidate cytidylyltransferase